MAALLLANLSRRPARTLLTALGTALGVATIVALLGVTAGVRKSAGGLVHLGRADLGLFQKDAADPTASVLPLSLVPRVERQPGVARATPMQLLVEAIPDQPAAIVFGADPRGFVVGRLVLSAGRAARAGREIAVGDDLARQAKLRVGDRLRLKRRPFRVVGIYHAGVFFEDTGAIVPLAAAQAIAGTAGEATTIAVQLEPQARPKAVGAALRKRFAGLQVITDAEEAARAGANGLLVSKATLVIVVLALIIGGISVANTMLMAVLERRGEFALLSAVGWSGPQVAALVLGEGVAVSLLGAAVGLLLGVVGSDLLVRVLGVSAFVSSEVTAWGLARGLIVGIAIGVLGGLYPAWRVTRLPPAPALARR